MAEFEENGNCEKNVNASKVGNPVTIHQTNTDQYCSGIHSHIQDMPTFQISIA